MSDITRDDLRVPTPDAYDYHERKVSDEEFDRLAREAGYVSLEDFNLPTGWRPTMKREDLRAHDAHCGGPHCSGKEPRPVTDAEVLRALLTDQCDCMGAPWCNRHNSQYINDGYCERVLDEEGVTPENMEERACQEEDHYDCHGRGWLPKDGVTPHTWSAMDRKWQFYSFPADWLEAKDE